MSPAAAWEEEAAGVLGGSRAWHLGEAGRTPHLLSIPLGSLGDPRPAPDRLGPDSPPESLCFWGCWEALEAGAELCSGGWGLDRGGKGG